MAQEIEKTTENEVKDEELGTIRIADDVVASIASYAALEVEGVAELAGTSTTAGLFTKNGKTASKKAGKGVRVEVNDGTVKADISVIMDYGYNIPATSSAIQAKVKSAVENMTGLEVSDVNIRIAGIRVADSE